MPSRIAPPLAPSLSLRGRLRLLVAACVLPLLAFGLGNAYLSYRADYAEASQRTQELARSLAMVVERDLQARLAPLQVLALSRALAAGDIEGFRAEAEAVVAQQLPGANILLLEENGQQVMNTALAPGVPLPSRPDTTTLKRLFATREASVSEVFQGVVVRRPVVALEVPVLRPDGSVAYGLTLNPTPDAFRAVIQRQQPRDSWIVSILDGQGKTVARLPDAGSFTGQKAGAELLAELLARPEGAVETTSLDGVPVLAAFSRVQGFGWSVVIGVPRADLAAPARRGVLATLGAGLAFLLVGLAAARRIARRITKPIIALRKLAGALDGGATPTTTGLAEADEVAKALVSAAAERQAATAALRDSEERWRAIAEASPMLIFVAGADGGNTYTNPQFQAFTGLAVAELVGSGWHRVVHPGDAAGAAAAWHGAVQAGSPYEVQYRIRRHDGAWRWFLCRAVPVRDPQGQIQRWFGTCADIEEATAARELLRTILETAPGLIYAKDREGRMLLANGPVMDLIGKPWSAVEGFTALEFFDDEAQAQAVMANDRRVMEDGRTQELEERTGGGSRARVWLSTKTPMRDAGGAVVGLVGVSVDITGRKRVEDQLRLLVNELNHRVKNTLASVQGIAAQTLRGADPAIARTLEGRLLALSAAHDVLTRERWEGAELHDVVTGALVPFRGEGPERFRVDGPRLRLEPRAALALALGLHELATNALKHGALSAGLGQVAIQWDITGHDEPVLRLAWTEAGGPPVAAPARRGFGTRLVERSLAQDLGGTARIDFSDPQGVRCVIEVPVSEVAAPAKVLPFPTV